MPLWAALATNRRAKSPPTGREPTRKRPRNASASGVFVRDLSARIRSHGLSTPRRTAVSKTPPPETSKYAKPAPSRSSARRSRSAVGMRPASGSWLRTRIVVSTRRGMGQDITLSREFAPNRSIRARSTPQVSDTCVGLLSCERETTASGAARLGDLSVVPDGLRADTRRCDRVPEVRRSALGAVGDPRRRRAPPAAGEALAADGLRQHALRRSLRSLDVALFARIELDLVADVDEQRHLDHPAGLEGGGLRHVGDGVALHAGPGVGHFEHAGGGQIDPGGVPP